MWNPGSYIMYITYITIYHSMLTKVSSVGIYREYGNYLVNLLYPIDYYMVKIFTM